MTRQRIMIGLLAAAVLFAGALVGVERLNACDGCPAHAKAAKAETVKNAAAEDVDANATKAKATKASCAPTCVGHARGVGGHATCASKAANARPAGAHAGCTAHKGAKSASSKSWCTDMKGHAKGELMSAEATLAKLAHCGVDVRSADTKVLVAKLGEAGCCDYTQEQWATMIESARAIDADKADVLYADACKGEPCKSENCPIAMVVRDLADEKAETENN